MSVVSVSVTERGRHTARRLPYEHVHGALATTVRGPMEGIPTTAELERFIAEDRRSKTAI